MNVQGIAQCTRTNKVLIDLGHEEDMLLKNIH